MFILDSSISFFDKVTSVLEKIWDTLQSIFNIIPLFIKFINNGIMLLPNQLNYILIILVIILAGITIYKFLR